MRGGKTVAIGCKFTLIETLVFARALSSQCGSLLLTICHHLHILLEWSASIASFCGILNIVYRGVENGLLVLVVHTVVCRGMRQSTDSSTDDDSIIDLIICILLARVRLWVRRDELILGRLRGGNHLNII